MKKFIAILICVVLATAFAVNAFAVQLDMTLTADKTVVKAGDVVTLTFAMPELKNCRSGGFVLEGFYDADVFEFVGGECLLDGTLTSNVGQITDILSGSFLYRNVTTVSGSIFTVQMKVKDTAAIGKTIIEPVVFVRDAAGDIEASINSLELKVVCVTHTWNAGEVTEPADCTEDAVKTFTCTVCGETETKVDAGSKLGHTFTNYVSDGNATCVADGTKTAKCDRCTVTETKVDAGSKLGHSFTNYISDNNATCLADGTKTAKCDRCTVTDTKTDVGSMTDHTYVDDICTACGAKAYIPGDLDDSKEVDETDVIYLLQHLLMPEYFPVNQPVDYDKNDVLDEDDVIYLLQHVLMSEEFPLV